MARDAVSEYLTIDEVCVLLKLGKRTVYDLCREGKLPGAAKIGNQWRVNRQQLDEWLAAGGAAPRSKGVGAEDSNIGTTIDQGDEPR